MRIKNWRKWQTYRADRGQPPWIKVHRRLMRSPEWIEMTDSQKGQLLQLWLLAADKEGEIPEDPLIIKKLCYMEKKPDIEFFVKQGFIEEWRQRDANVTPTWRQHDAPEAEAEAEAEKKREEKNIVSETKSPSKIVRFSPEDMDLANWMFEQTLKLNPSRKKPNMDEWAKIIRLMRERDKRSHGEIRDLFKWANNHSFWKANILSPSKLRKQWDRLIPQRNSGNNGNHKNTSASENQFHHDLYRKIAAEAAAEEMDGGVVRAPAPEVWDSVDTPIRRVRGHH